MLLILASKKLQPYTDKERHIYQQGDSTPNILPEKQYTGRSWRSLHAIGSVLKGFGKDVVEKWKKKLDET